MVRYAIVPRGKIDEKRVAPGAVGYQRDLYTFPYHDADSAQSLELGLFSYIDTYAAGALDRMVRGDIPQESEWRTAFAMFLFSLQRRTPHGIEAAMKEVDKDIRAKIDILDDDERYSGYNDGLRLVALSRLLGVKDESELGRAVINMKWVVLDTASAGVSLLTSDNPALFLGDGPTPTGISRMPISKLKNFVLPLSPDKLLVGRWATDPPIKLETMTANATVKAFNKYIAQSAKSIIIAADHSHARFIAKHFASGSA